MNKGGAIVLAILALVMGLGYLAFINARGPVTLATYSDSSGVPFVFIDSSLLQAEGNAYGFAMLHETFHALRRWSLIDYDVPTAAAFGYLNEWFEMGNPADPYRIPAFREGLEGRAVDAGEILRRYANDQDREPLSAYDDGARLAGIALRTCGGTIGGAGIYLNSVSMGVAPEDAIELCRHDAAAFSIVSGLRSGTYFLLDEDLLRRELSDNKIEGWREKHIEAVTELLDQRYRTVYFHRQRLSTINDAGTKAEWLTRRKKAGLDLEDHPIGLAFQLHEEWQKGGTAANSELYIYYRLGFRSPDEVGEALLASASMDDQSHRRDAAMLAGIMKRIFGNDLEVAWRYAQMAAFGLSHVDAIAIAQDERLFNLVCSLRDGRFTVIDKQLLERDLAPLDGAARAAVLWYVGQLNSEYEIRYIQPALKGRGTSVEYQGKPCISDGETACLLGRYFVRVQWVSISTSDTGYAAVMNVSATSATFDVGGASVEVTVTDNDAHGIACRIRRGPSYNACIVTIFDVKEKQMRAWRARAGEEMDTGLFLLSDG